MGNAALHNRGMPKTQAVTMSDEAALVMWHALLDARDGETTSRETVEALRAFAEAQR